MSQVTPLQSSFNAGELSPHLHARTDQNVRSIGVKQMHGWLPRLQGPAEACPGTIHVAQAKVPAFRLIPYRFTVTQHYVIEISAGAMRFYTNEARIETAPGVAYEIAAPWTVDQLADLSWRQINDQLYLYHPAVQTRKLNRTSATTFSLTAVLFEGGPFEPQNRDKALTVSASDVTGTITVEASAALFEAGDVGGLLRIEAADLGSVAVWEPGITVTAGDLRQSPSLGIVYQALTGGRTGTVEPVHSESAEWDGMAAGTDVNGTAAGGIQWQYLHDRYGLVRITAYVSATEVDAEVVRRLPSTTAVTQTFDTPGGPFNPWVPTDFDPTIYDYTPPGTATFTPGTWRWQWGSFSNRRGWPACGAIWNERHCVGKDNIIHGSVTGGFGDKDDFSPLNEFGDPSRDMAFQWILPEPDSILWMQGDEQLLLGTAKSEFRLGAASAADGAGPGNLACPKESGQGARAGMPVEIDGAMLFVQNARRRVVEFVYQTNRDRFETPDLSRFAEHIGVPKFGEIAFVQEPSKLLWAVRDDGQLAAALYDPREQALGWATRALGGGWKAKTVTSIRDSNGEFDQLWIGATNAAGTAGHVLRLARVRLGGEEAKRMVMLDAVAIAEGDGVASVAAPHLAGATVSAQIDGVPHAGIVVANDGTVTLPVAGDQVIVGYDFPAELTLLKMEAGGDNGPAYPKLTRINRGGLSLLAARGLWIDAQGVEQPLETANIDTPFDSEAATYTGIFWVQTVGKFDRAGELTISRRLPYPATLLAVVAEMDVAQHGGRA